MNQLLAATYVRTLAAGKQKMIEAILWYLKIAQFLLFLLHFIRILTMDLSLSYKGKYSRMRFQRLPDDRANYRTTYYTSPTRTMPKL